VADEVHLGHVSGVFGVRGELRLFLHNPQTALFSEPAPVFLLLPDGSWQRRTLVIRSGAGKRILGKLEGVHSPEAAEAYIGAELLIDRAELPRLPEGEHYLAQLIGTPVVNASGEALGTLSDIVTGEVDMWVIDGPEGEERFLPALKALILAVEPGVKITVVDGAGELI
jgi:16S rRNA processing protein RimM